MRKRIWLATGLLVLALLGAAGAVAAAALTTGTVSACATTPDQTIADNGSPIATVPGQASCTTVTYTVPTKTVTTTVAGTTTDPTTTTAPTTTTTASGWTNVVNDQFNDGAMPSHYQLYHSPYGSSPNNCTSPTHDYVANGYLNLVESWEPSTPAGVSCPYSAGWYTGGMKLDPVAPYIGNDQRVTVRYRIVSTGGIVSHHIIPMRWPTATTYVYRKNNGESDFLESDSDTSERTFLHYVDASGTGQQVSSPLMNVDLSQWHTVQVTQLSHVVTVNVDGQTLWTYTGNSTTVPDVLRTVVLQQECNHSTGCPSGTTGSEDIQIDWLTVDNVG